jgi:anion-transporting  ArsA/GET3 family ATPase
MTPLWERRLVVTTGKGGVGKTTVAAAITLAAARAGKRACVAELDGQWRIQRMFGHRARSYEPVPIAPGADAMSLSPVDCLDDFGKRKLRLDAMVRLVLTNRLMTAFVEAVPGLHDLLQLGKLDNMLNEPLPTDTRYDVIVLDAPATGHGLTLLAAARAMSDLARVGPLYELSHAIERLIDDPARTACVIVTLPEDLPVNETLELVDALGDERPLLQAVIANQVRAPALPSTPPWPVVEAALSASPVPEVRALGEMAGLWIARERDQRAALERLERGLGQTPLLRLPQLEPHELRAEDLRALADDLGREAR